MNKSLDFYPEAGAWLSIECFLAGNKMNPKKFEGGELQEKNV